MPHRMHKTRIWFIRAYFKVITGGAQAPPAPLMAPPVEAYGPTSKMPFFSNLPLFKHQFNAYNKLCIECQVHHLIKKKVKSLKISIIAQGYMLGIWFGNVVID